jgi:hypothetical protein
MAIIASPHVKNYWIFGIIFDFFKSQAMKLAIFF